MTKFMPFLMLLFLGFFIACEPEDPDPENDEESITDITLNFVDDSGNTLTTVASDPDGDGPEDVQFEESFTLKTSTQYTLSIDLFNSMNNEDITQEVQEEAAEHQMFFAWSDGLFSDPSGTGNIADATGTVNYSDSDSNGNPLGIVTEWTTGTEVGTERDFQIILKHQPDIKTADTGAQDGETDIDLTFTISLED